MLPPKVMRKQTNALLLYKECFYVSIYFVSVEFKIRLYSLMPTISDQKTMNMAAFGGKSLWDPILPITNGFTITICVENF